MVAIWHVAMAFRSSTARLNRDVVLVSFARTPIGKVREVRQGVPARHQEEVRQGAPAVGTVDLTLAVRLRLEK